MNLIICMLIVWVVLDFKINFILGSYKKRRNEHCSLQVNSLCYDDELGDKPLKIVHDENGIKTIVGDKESMSNKKKNQKKSTDIIQPKISRQLSWDLTKLKLFSKLNFNQQQKPVDQSSNTNQQPINFIGQNQINRPKLIFKYHKLNANNLPFVQLNTNLPKSIQSDLSTTIIPLPYNLPTLSSPTNNPSLNPTLSPMPSLSHLDKFKIWNRPLLESGSINNVYLKNNLDPILNNNKLSHNSGSPFVNSLTFKLSEHHTDNSLLTSPKKSSSNNYFTAIRPPTKIVSNYVSKNTVTKSIPINLSYDYHRTTTSPIPIKDNNWITNYYYSTPDTPELLTEPLPSNLINYVNLRESGQLNSYLANQTMSSEINLFNTTQDRIWTGDDEQNKSNEIFSTKSTLIFNLNDFDGNRTTKKEVDFNQPQHLLSTFDKFQFDNSGNSLENDSTDLNAKSIINSLNVDLTTTPHTIDFSTEESSKEEIDTFKLANQLTNHPNEFEITTKDLNQQQNNYFTSSFGKDHLQNNKLINNENKLMNSDLNKEFSSNEKFESIQPLNHQHEWPTMNHDSDMNVHHIDELITNDKLKSTSSDVDKSTINYLTDDEHKENVLLDPQNFPIFYPIQTNSNGNHHQSKPTYTIIQTKNKNLDKFKKYAKLLKKVAFEEAKKFKKNELDTFLRRKKLIIDRYKPNDMFQKAIAAKYVWKKVSLDFLSLLGYQISNYLSPLNSKHWIKHSNLLDDKTNEEQLKALEHILKNQPNYYQSSNPHINKYHFSNELGDQEFSDDTFNNIQTQTSNVDNFLNDDSLFNQNYFKIKDNLNDNSYLNQKSNKIYTEQPLINVLDNEQIKPTVDTFQYAHLNKEKEMDKQFYQNQLLNNKLLSNQLANDKEIDFRTKEKLEQIIN